MTKDELKERADAAHQWWRSLGPVKLEDGRMLSGDRAALARLRRCSSVNQAIAEPPTRKLFKKLDFEIPRGDSDVWRLDNVERVAALAVVLAHVKDNDRRRIAIAIGAPPGGEANEALVKPNRFRTLMAARTGDEIMTSFRRVVAMLDGTASVQDLARLILGWTDDDAGDRTRANFAFAYHGAADFAPDDDAGKAGTAQSTNTPTL